MTRTNALLIGLAALAAAAGAARAAVSTSHSVNTQAIDSRVSNPSCLTSSAQRDFGTVYNGCASPIHVTMAAAYNYYFSGNDDMAISGNGASTIVCHMTVTNFTATSFWIGPTHNFPSNGNNTVLNVPNPVGTPDIGGESVECDRRPTRTRPPLRPRFYYRSDGDTLAAMRSSLGVVVLSALTSAGMYLVMHFAVGPHLPLPDAEVPPIAGLSAEQARGLLEPRGLRLILDGERVDERVPAGTLTAQMPLGGSRLARGGEVHASIAVAPSAPTVPKLAGLPVAAAREALAKARLHPGSVTEQPSDTVPAGQVIATSPVVGVELKVDSVVDLVVSSGPAAQPVPSVVGKSFSKAKEMLEKAGFALGSKKYGSNDDYDQGVVIGQTPAGNTPAARGAKIDLVVND